MQRPSLHRRSLARAAALALAAMSSVALPSAAGQPSALTSAIRVPDPPSVPGQRYELHVGGLRIAEMTLRTEAGRLGYTAHARIETAGMARAFFALDVDAWAEGTIRGGRWQTRAFRTRTAANDKRQAVEIVYAGDRPARVLAEPAFQPKPWEIEPGDHPRTLDPLSAFATMARLPDRAAPCTASHEVFDGRRVHRLVLSPAARPSETPGVRRCDARYQRVAGFKQKYLDRPDFPLILDYAEHPAGGWLLIRAMGDTPAGTAVISRRSH